MPLVMELLPWHIQQWAPRLDAFIVQGMPGLKPAMRQSLV